MKNAEALRWDVRDGATERDWVRAHAALRRLARERAVADAEEGRWLLVAWRSGTHVFLGFGSSSEYIERRLGYSPRATREKLRVAEALEALPQSARALEQGALTWWAARELTRVATGDTEAAWLEAARGKTTRELERRVAGRQPGDLPLPTEPQPPRRHVMRFEVAPETFATFREATQRLRCAAGGQLDDDALLLMMARHVLGAPPDERSSYRLSFHVCGLRPGLAECSRRGRPGKYRGPRHGRMRRRAAGRHRPPRQRERLGRRIRARSSADVQHLRCSLAARDPCGPLSAGRSPRRAPRRPRSRSSPLPGPGLHPQPLRRRPPYPPTRRRRPSHSPEPHHPVHRPSPGDPSWRAHHRNGRHGAGLSPCRWHTLRATAAGRIGPIPHQIFSALRHLGFREREVQTVLAELRADVSLRDAPTEHLLREALRRIRPHRSG